MSKKNSYEDDLYELYRDLRVATNHELTRTVLISMIKSCKERFDKEETP